MKEWINPIFVQLISGCCIFFLSYCLVRLQCVKTALVISFPGLYLTSPHRDPLGDYKKPRGDWNDWMEKISSQSSDASHARIHKRIRRNFCKGNIFPLEYQFFYLVIQSYYSFDGSCENIDAWTHHPPVYDLYLNSLSVDRTVWEAKSLISAIYKYSGTSGLGHLYSGLGTQTLVPKLQSIIFVPVGHFCSGDTCLDPEGVEAPLHSWGVFALFRNMQRGRMKSLFRVL